MTPIRYPSIDSDRKKSKSIVKNKNYNDEANNMNYQGSKQLPPFPNVYGNR